MGLAPAAYVLWTRVLKHNPDDPKWPDRDRFVLSGGHASMLLYSVLYLSGYDLTLDDIKAFRQWGSKTPGHPEYGQTPGVETTTGPLGQGFANAVGMAMAERSLAARFNREGHPVVDHHTYVFCGDGDIMEGITYESVSFAGHLGLDKLICIYDDNRISIEGSTGITFTEDVKIRFEACNWQVLKIENGNDVDAIHKALIEAKNETEKPSLIMLRTHIAYGSPTKQDSCEAHGAPLGEEEVIRTKQALCCPYNENFCVPDRVLEAFQKYIQKGKDACEKWNDLLRSYRETFPELSAEFEETIAGNIPEGWDADMPVYSSDDKPVATRVASGKALNAIAPKIPALMGGSADLATSNKTLIDGSIDFQKGQYHGRNIRFGVREHAMTAIVSGMSLHKGILPYCGTFLVFADYMRPAIRVAALMRVKAIYVFTHDSIAVGEDGPTHQPIEHLASLRAIPQLTVIRPADATETVEAWRAAITSTGPVALILSRQKLPVIDRIKYNSEKGLKFGGYVLYDTHEKPDVILIATGSEVAPTLKAKDILEEKGVKVRVVSMPSWEMYDKMPSEYKDSVLLPEVRARLAVEAGLSMGWSRYVLGDGGYMCIDRYGRSAPGDVLMEKFGYTPVKIANEALNLLS
jgi:transketolase